MVIRHSKITEAEVLNAVNRIKARGENVTCDTVARETGVTYHTVELHIMTLRAKGVEGLPRKASRRDPIAAKRIEMIKAAAASFGDRPYSYSDLARETDLEPNTINRWVNLLRAEGQWPFDPYPSPGTPRMKPNAAKPDPVECGLCGNMVPKVVAYPGIEGKVCRACRDELIEEDRARIPKRKGERIRIGDTYTAYRELDTVLLSRPTGGLRFTLDEVKQLAEVLPALIKQAETYIALSRKANVQPIECSTSPDRQ